MAECHVITIDNTLIPQLRVKEGEGAVSASLWCSKAKSQKAFAKAVFAHPEMALFCHSKALPHPLFCLKILYLLEAIMTFL